MSRCASAASSTCPGALRRHHPRFRHAGRTAEHARGEGGDAKTNVEIAAGALAEVELDYEAVVALEPDVIRQVVAEGGIRPERLTFVRKARGAEAHVGGQRVLPGDPADACIRSWLGGAVDQEMCKNAVPRLAEP